MPRARVKRAVNGGSVGALATLPCELGQVRKEAAAASDVCAGMSLAGPPPISAATRPVMTQHTHVPLWITPSFSGNKACFSRYCPLLMAWGNRICRPVHSRPAPVKIQLYEMTSGQPSENEGNPMQ